MRVDLSFFAANFYSFCSDQFTIGQFKQLISQKLGTPADRLILKKWYNTYKDHITLSDCKCVNYKWLVYFVCVFVRNLDEIASGSNMELYYK